MNRHLLVTAACAGLLSFAGTAALAQAEGAKAAGTQPAKTAKSASPTPAARAVNAATGAKPAAVSTRPAGAQPKAESAWKDGCSHAKDSDA
jgi:hypothetical protein